MDSLIFVYNADSGKFNALTDSLHKLISPDTYQCRLCELTHGIFVEKAEWAAFIKENKVKASFLHRDEFIEKFPKYSDIRFPVIFVEEGNQLRPVINSSEFEKINSLELLCKELESHLT